ncbi:hypothetical protein SH2C18_42810 [Clostridium sediminicola]|uniref:hypothetical protein n=1 Tax=Clostridium sediminicola TaxID=3114879 RepID=UPI0031F26D06
MNKKEMEILRKLGRQYAEIIASPVNDAKKKLWQSINDFKMERPMVLIDQIPWHEMNVNDELTLKTEDPFLRIIENNMRQTIYKWNHMRADMVVDPYISIPRAIQNTGFGIKADEDISVSDEANDVVGHSYNNQLKTEEDIQKIKTPIINEDKKCSKEREEMAKLIFDGIVPVRMEGHVPSFALWDKLAKWIGPQNVLYEVIDRPEFIHAIMDHFTKVNLEMIDQLEAKGLLDPFIPYTHCSHNYTKDPLTKDFNPDMPKAKDCWTSGMAQIFVSISPALHQEFEFNYVKKIYERFGAVYYGCCEPLHNRLDMIKEIPNVRKISCSPWCDIDIAAEKIGSDYVISNKPTPANLATDRMQWDIIEDDIKHTMDAARRNNSPLEFILKDISTVRHEPQRLWEWEKRVMNLVKRW